MTTLDATVAVFSLYPPSSSKFLFTQKPPPSVKLHRFTYTPPLSHKLFFSPLPLPNYNPARKLSSELGFAMQEIAVEAEAEAEAEAEETQELNQKRKLYVANLPWSLSVADIKNIFGECGTVKDVEIIKQKDGKSRGFAFVTMASGEESQAVVDKFDSYELSGRTIRVEFARRFKRPPPPPPPSTPPAGETRHKLYVSNLAWKARASHLRELFSADFNLVSARVVFDGSSGSAGYGFVSFATKEEADAAILALDGKEVLGRPIRLKLSEKNTDESGKGEGKEDQADEQPDESGKGEGKEDQTDEQPDES